MLVALRQGRCWADETGEALDYDWSYSRVRNLFPGPHPTCPEHHCCRDWSQEEESAEEVPHTHNRLPQMQNVPGCVGQGPL